ncbi:hypothetical protein C8Q73DRAFT_145863 [Cubamyces lactineus]|nr:hypothetical protein C8Q73DRAFT_145863 [Cubamyces lactineus]
MLRHLMAAAPCASSVPFLRTNLALPRRPVSPQSPSRWDLKPSSLNPLKIRWKPHVFCTSSRTRFTRGMTRLRTASRANVLAVCGFVASTFGGPCTRTSGPGPCQSGYRVLYIRPTFGFRLSSVSRRIEEGSTHPSLCVPRRRRTTSNSSVQLSHTALRTHSHFHVPGRPRVRYTMHALWKLIIDRPRSNPGASLAELSPLDAPFSALALPRSR